MVARTPSTWNVEEDNLMNAAFAAMAVNWPRLQREDLAQFITDSLFPLEDGDTPWEIIDHTTNAKDGIPYFKIFIKLYDQLSVWFRNLRILQIRVKLGLNDSYCVAQGLGDSQLGAFAAKIEVVRAIVGTAKLVDCIVPELKRKDARRDFSNLSNVRALSLRGAGLRERRNCTKN